MLARLVRIQLVIFSLASVIGLAAMFFHYLQVASGWASEASGPRPTDYQTVDPNDTQ